MYNSLTKDSIRKKGCRKHIDNLCKQKYIIMLFYYYRYKCQLQEVDGDY